MNKALILSLTGLALALTAAPAKAQDIKIAVAGPITGPVATIGEQIKRGAEAAAAAINEAGGVNGRKIKIVVEDDQCDPKQAVAVANHIVGQQIKFVDGHACSGSSIPASEVYADNKVLMMSPASSNPKLTEKGLRRSCASTAATTPRAPSSRRGSPRNSRARRSPSCTTRAPTARASRRSCSDKLNKLGVKEVLFEGINPGEKDYSAHRQQAEGGRRRIRLLRRLSP